MLEDRKTSRERAVQSFSKLLDVMDKLREKCPWNAAQTNQSLRHLSIEEVYELSDAILKEDDKELKKELGDIIFHVIFYSKIASEQEKFDIADVIDAACEKMIFRHPHVFASKEDTEESSGKKLTAEEISENWELIKLKEKGGNKTILSGVPDAMPPVLKALAMQEKAAGAGLELEENTLVLDNVRQKERELEIKIQNLDACAKTSDEQKIKQAECVLGDFIFSIINAARVYGLNSDTALNMSCDRFRKQVTELEKSRIK